MERALGWHGPERLGNGFARGHIDDPASVSRILTPHRLLDIAMRRSPKRPQFRCFRNGEEVHPAVHYTDSVNPRGQSISMVNLHSLADHVPPPSDETPRHTVTPEVGTCRHRAHAPLRDVILVCAGYGPEINSSV